MVGWLLGALAADRWGWAFPAAFGAVALTCTVRYSLMLLFATCQGCCEGACQGCMHAKEWLNTKDKIISYLNVPDTAKSHLYS